MIEERNENKYESLWKSFFEKIGTDTEFDNDLKKFLENIKEISELNLQNIESNKKNIDEKLGEITKFVDKYKNEYYEIEKIVGFRQNIGNKIKGKDYYYYIADQKIKASIYYIRYLNFIQSIFKEKADIIENIKNALNDSEIQKKFNDLYEKIIKLQPDENLREDLQIIANYIDEICYDEIPLINIRELILEGILAIDSKNSSYMKYMLFNNVMKEIRYIGAAYQYVWNWQRKDLNLYRCFFSEINESNNCKKEDVSKKEKLSKKIYMQEMFKSIISHMNEPGGILASYSKDPYLDIYKYLKLPKSKEYCDKEVVFDNELIKVEIMNLKNEFLTNFEIIKNAPVNSIKYDGQVMSFYDFIQEEKIEVNNEIAYAVEIYPDLKGEKNEKGTTKNMKRFLIEYLQSWEANKEKLLSYIADDKEIVMKGEIYNKEIYINREKDNKYRDKENNTCFKMKLSKEDIIYLLLKIRPEIRNNYEIVDKVVDKIVDKLEVTHNNSGKKINDFMVEYLNLPKEATLSTKIAVKTDNAEFEIKLQVTLKSNYFKQDKFKKEVDGSEIFINAKQSVNLLMRDIKDIVQEYFKDRYSRILDTSHEVSDFILDFIAEEEYSSNIRSYNEFKSEYNDIELVMLKHFIFKEGV